MDENVISHKGSGPLSRRAQASGKGDQHTKVERQPPDRYWPSTLMVLGILIGIVTFIVVGKVTLVSNEYLARSLALLGLAGTLIPLKWLGLRLGMEPLEWVMFNVLAVGPITLSALLWLNFMVHGTPQWQEHKVESIGHYNSAWRIEFIDDAFIDQPGFREFDDHTLGFPRVGSVRYALAKGCLGRTVITKREVVAMDL